MQPFNNEQGVFSGTGRAVYEVQNGTVCAVQVYAKLWQVLRVWRLSGTSCEHSRPNH